MLRLIQVPYDSGGRDRRMGTTGFMDGMPVSMAVGHCWKALTSSIPGFRPLPENRVMLVGACDLDNAEYERLDASEVHVVPSATIQQHGVEEVQGCIRTIAGQLRLVGASVTAYDPDCDVDDKGLNAGLSLIELLAQLSHEQPGLSNNGPESR
jgi:arginase